MGGDNKRNNSILVFVHILRTDNRDVGTLHFSFALVYVRLYQSFLLMKRQTNIVLCNLLDVL